jgi:(p)ppGpp synthase/HD superfamily hydrolase
MIALTKRFEDALVYATRLHAQQERKAMSVPYVSHLLSVAALVIEDGGDEDEVIAGLLHDAVEDQGGVATLQEIRTLFGERVAEIVDGCTDAYQIPKPPWRERKEYYLAKLEMASPSIRRVSLADKLHNARTLLSALRQNGNDVWTFFNGGQAGTIWYYEMLQEYFEATGDDPMTREFVRVVLDIKNEASLHSDPHGT